MKTILIFSALLLGVFCANSAMATHFDGCGSPYCGCGIPQSILPTPNFLALNVQKTPYDYSTYLLRPIQDSSKLGPFNNGKNCGRWIKVTLGKFCTGTNSGLPGKPFCEGGQWVDDSFTGATQNYIVADSCQDGNRWCRDDIFHTDLSTASLKTFEHNGQKVDVSNKWNNREVSWDFINGPTLPIKLYFGQKAQQYYPVIIVTGFSNGLSGVQQFVNNAWSRVKMVSDLGQAHLLNNGIDFQIRLLDLNNQVIGGKTYKFGFPASCPNHQCGNNPVYEIQFNELMQE